MMELRPTRTQGEAQVPTDWDVIHPYGQAVGLDTDDMQTLALMCQGYCEAWYSGQNPLAIAPVDRKESNA